MTDEYKARRKIYYETNRDRLLEQQRQYYIEHPEKEKEKHQRYYEKNRIEILEKKKITGQIYRDNNKDIIQEKNKIYYENNKEKIQEKNKLTFKCECGLGEFVIKHQARHRRCKKHIDAINLHNNIKE
jgi:ribosomal protein S27AE